MLKKWLSCICAAILLLGLGGCEDNSRKVKIGVSIGAGGAARWQKDMAFMQERAKALGADIELRLNLPDSSKTQAEDCLEMLSMRVLCPGAQKCPDCRAGRCYCHGGDLCFGRKHCDPARRGQ